MCGLDAKIQRSIFRSVDVVAMTKSLDDAFNALQTTRLGLQDEMEMTQTTQTPLLPI
jgi:hypothetical protein